MRFVYNAYNGRYADSPRALHQGLLARGSRDEHVWLADARHADSFPEGVATVPVGSPAAAAALDAADVVVANSHITLDPWTKHRDTVYLQTWHGTPLKRIHRSAVSLPGPEIMAELDADIARWDYLITPSGAGTELLRSTFAYGGEVLETGYPRNDVLHGAGTTERRARIRRELGLCEDTTAILYAPTYRDDEVTGEDVPLGLDLDALLSQLGDSHVLLLRQHYFLGHRRPYEGRERVRDVSRYAEVSDLLLAADALVTDYSSVLFDFAGTGKPIVIYAYDLEHYRDDLRGFTLDVDNDLPGPLLHDQGALHAALQHLPEVVAAYADRYAIFRERFCHLDDGRATDRVLDRLWPA